MNDPSLNPSSEEELDARITAVVLGEASEFERDQIDRLIEQRPELVAMRARIENMHQMLHDVGHEPWSAEAEGDWKLPSKQRATLLDILDDESGKMRIAAAPHARRSAAKISQFAKIGAVFCAACLLLVLGLSKMVPSIHTAMEVITSQPDFISADVEDAFEKTDRAPGFAIARRSGPTSSGGMGGMGRQKADQAVLEDSLDKSPADSLPSPYYLQDDVQYFPVPPIVAEPVVDSQFSEFGMQVPSAARDVRQSGEVNMGFSVASRALDGLADRLSSTSSQQARRELLSNGRMFSIDEKSTLARDEHAPAASETQSFATEQEQRSFNFAAPLSLQKKMRLERSQLLETEDSKNAPEIKVVEPAESKSRLFDEVQADDVVVAAGVNLPQSNREAISGPEVQRVAPGDKNPSQPAKKEQEVEQLFRTTDKRVENQSLVDFVPESSTSAEPFSTFSLHVSDVSFKLAAAALAQGQWPEAATVRVEEFVNAMDYADPLPSQHEMVACRIEQSIDPFLQQRNLLRVSLRTAAAGRAATTPLRLTLLLDNSGSMERMDRQQTVRRAFETLTQQLQPGDQITLISFARTPRLLADRVSGEGVKELAQLIENLPSEGGTNIEAALQLAWEKAREQWTAGAQNRIILLTDGAVNLGDAEPEQLSKMVTNIRDTGIAFDAAGISANGLNDEVLEALTRKGDGRYYLLDSEESADAGFARQIAGALRPAAMNAKVQIEFNPERVGHYRLLGFEKHRLNKEDFRNDQVDAAEMSAAEAGVAVYQFEPLPGGEGDVGSVSVRFRDMSTGQMIERRWPILYQSNPPRVDQASASMRLATAASMFAAKLRGGPFGESIDLNSLSKLLAELPPQTRSAPRVQQLQLMIQQARQISGQ